MRAARQAGDEAKIAELKSVMQSQRAQMKQMHAEKEAQFVSVLTPEQRTQFDAIKAERAARRAQREQKQQ
jgi:Spy/CpxP family protein refolding chaperone